MLILTCKSFIYIFGDREQTFIWSPVYKSGFYTISLFAYSQFSNHLHNISSFTLAPLGSKHLFGHTVTLIFEFCME
jgi:hypothetical protein